MYYHVSSAKAGPAILEEKLKFWLSIIEKKNKCVTRVKFWKPCSLETLGDLGPLLNRKSFIPFKNSMQKFQNVVFLGISEKVMQIEIHKESRKTFPA